MTEIYYDTEFLEDGRTIELISIGMVAEDGRELYAVNADMPWKRIVRHDWLRANVVPSLPVIRHDGIRPFRHPILDRSHPDMFSRERIAQKIARFIASVPDPELWAWYGAYDHVVLCQLWGRMIDLPEGVPMWTNDLKQEAVRLGNPDLPPLPGAREHNALDDAREVMFRRKWLRSRPPTQVVPSVPL